MRVQEIMTRTVLTVTPDTQVKRAAALLARRGFTALPVVDEDDRLVGIVTEADLVHGRIPPDPRHLVHADGPAPPRPNRATVAEVMSSPVTVTGPGADVAEVADTMLSAHRRCLPVLDGGRLVGIVTRGDLVRVVGRDDDAIAREVRHKLEIYGGPGRWRVDVRDGVVHIGDACDSEADHHAVIVLAEAVPGVTRAIATRSGGMG